MRVKSSFDNISREGVKHTLRCSGSEYNHEINAQKPKVTLSGKTSAKAAVSLNVDPNRQIPSFSAGAPPLSQDQ